MMPVSVCAAGPADADIRGEWVAQLSRLQLLAARWLAIDPQQLLQQALAGKWKGQEQSPLGVSDLHDQVCGGDRLNHPRHYQPGGQSAERAA
jgi:hypothetical protein